MNSLEKPLRHPSHERMAHALLRFLPQGVVRIAILVLLPLLFAGCGWRAASGFSQEHRDLSFRGKPVILWCDTAGLGGRLASAESAASFCRVARVSGVTHLGVEVLDAAGRPLFQSDTSHAPVLENLMRKAPRAGLRVAAVMPLFQAPPDATPERLVHRAAWNGSAYELSIDLSGGQNVRRLSPADPEVVRSQLALVDAVMADPRFDIVILTGLGFEDSLADLGPAARRAFEAWAGVSIRHWPEEIIGETQPDVPFGREGRGPLWDSWVTWRAGVLRDFLFRVGERAAVQNLRPPIIAVLVDGPYQTHPRQGLNWASSGVPVTAVQPWLPMDYERTGAGHLMDAVALGFWEPELITSRQAEEAGFAWWASLEGSGAIARRFLPHGTVPWAAIPVMQDTAWGIAARAAYQWNDGLLILPASIFVSEPANWETLSLALEPSPR